MEAYKYEIGTALSIEHTLENADAILIVVDDDDTGYGYQAELKIKRLPDGTWDVKQEQCSQIVNRKFDDWMDGSIGRKIPVSGTGLEALAQALADLYEADKDILLRLLQEHDNACQAAMAAKEV